MMSRQKAVRVVPFHNVDTFCECLDIGRDDVLNVYILNNPIEHHVHTAENCSATRNWCKYAVPSATSRAMSGIVVVNDTTVLTHHKWKNSDWFRSHGWVAPSPKGHKGLYKGFQHVYVSQTSDQLVEYHGWMFTQSSFQLLLEQYAPFAVECLFLPKACIWQTTVAFPLFPHATSNVDEDKDCWKRQLATSFTGVAQLLVWKASLEWDFTKRVRGPCSLKVEQGNVHTALRTLSLALHVLERARRYIQCNTNTSEKEDGMNHEYDGLILSLQDNPTWKDCMHIFQPIHERLLTDLRTSFIYPSEGGQQGLFDPTWLLQIHLDKHRKLQYTCECKYCANVVDTT